MERLRVELGSKGFDTFAVDPYSPDSNFCPIE
jgi:hypothetical protein